MNFTRELSMFFREQSDTDSPKDDSITFNTLKSYLQFKYDLTKPENEKLLVRWLHKITRIKEIQIGLPQEVEVLRNSHLGVLYVMPNVSKKEMLEEFYKINYMKNSIFGIPFMWLNYDQITMLDDSENKIFACKCI
jgi:hypothetical protein